MRAVVNAPRADRALTHGGLDEHRVARHGVGIGVALRQVCRPREVFIRFVLRPADLHRLLRGGDDGGVQPRPLSCEREERTVVRGIDVIYLIFIYDPIEAVYERGIVDKGDAVHAVFKHELRMARHARRAEKAHELAEFERVVYLQRDLRSRREHQHIFHITHALPSFSAPLPRRSSFFTIDSI